MIKVKILRNVTNEITAFHVSGHAEYDVSGKDIVCAGVSAVVIGTVNAVEVLLNIELPSEMNSGLLLVKIPEISDQMVSKQAQLLLESMVIMLQTIKQSYGKYISIDDK